MASTENGGAHPEAWPDLPVAAWSDTYRTLHMYAQVVGKIGLAYSPMVNQWWQVAMRLTARGLSTSPIPVGGRTLLMALDLLDLQLVLQTSDGGERRVELGSTVQAFYREAMDALRALGIEARIWPMPVEVPDPVRFDRDDRPVAFDADAVRRAWRILAQVASIFEEFRGGFTGKCSPVHFFWGSFDLAVTRFSGRPAAPPPGADRITRLGYDAELSSLGFWFGGPGLRATTDGPAFYSYAYPEPAGFRDQPVRPEAAFYHDILGEFLLPYDDVRTSADPRRAILDFAQSTYEAAARLQGWPMDRFDLGGEEDEAEAGASPDAPASALAASKAPNPDDA